MRALIVFTHPDPSSLTATIARGIAHELDGDLHTEVADLSREGFAPAFTVDDLAAYRGEGPLPADVLHEQKRLQEADVLVVVHPILWWGAPSLLKGWFERVFTRGWAYGPGGDGLRGKEVHLVGLGASRADRYELEGYRDAMRTALDHGVFDYCTARVTTSRILYESERERTVSTLTGFVTAIVDDIRSGLARRHV